MTFYIAAYSNTVLLNYMAKHRIQRSEVCKIFHPNDLRGLTGGNLYVLWHPWDASTKRQIEQAVIDRMMKIIEIDYETTKEQLIQFEQEKE